MIVKRLATSVLVLGFGYALAGGLFWILLSVPESNVAALLASALVVVSVVVCAGLATAGALAVTDGATAREAVWRALKTLPFFLLGLGLFTALLSATTWIDSWWTVHQGEIDATVLRYLGVTNTGWFHLGVAWITWMLRWGLGLSIVAGLVAAGTSGPGHSVSAGLRSAIRLPPLTMAIAAVLIVSQGLWRWAYWRPAGLTPSGAEVMFVTAKLGFLYVLVIALAAAVLDVHRRAARRPA